MDSQQSKWKQRQALENCYSNFVEPYVNQFIEVNTQSLPDVPVTSYSGLCFTSGWLLLTLLCCVRMMRWQRK
ncbi:hypothetical protein [Planktothricoides raciborskii]|uniref:Uncharacterized protein n=1 Tax=Planktothricoides raciborskii GIHE-MW2 TaxID=2792601 RepID=A0AAU8JA90_9CYAN